jgi:heptosyltransferase-1
VSAGAPANPPRSLLVVRLGAMGDVIHTMYAVSLLRQSLPETQIGWVIEERWAELLCAKGEPRSGARSPSRPLVDFVHVVNTKSWRKAPLASETRQQFSAALKEIREQQYDVAIDFQGAIKSVLLARLSRPKTLLGMDEPREAPARLFYSQRVRTNGAHVIEQYGSLAEAVLVNRRTSLDRTAEGGRPYANLNASGDVLPRDTAAEQVIADKLHTTNAPIVLINPGAGWGAKEWSPVRYGEVARALTKEGARVLVNYGPGEEQLAKIVQDSSDGAAEPITCSIAELIALTRQAKSFIGGDTGPLHLASAMGVPVIAIFGPTDPARNGPYSQNSIVVRNPASRTSLSHTREPDRGLLQIMPDQVLAAARKLLGSHHA